MGVKSSREWYLPADHQIHHFVTLPQLHLNPSGPSILHLMPKTGEMTWALEAEKITYITFTCTCIRTN